MNISPLSPRAALLCGAAISTLATAAVIYGAGLADPALRDALRLTGRLSFLLFFVAFALGRQLGAHRRTFGLSFAGSHAVHAALIVTLVVTVPGTRLAPLVLVFGGLGFVFLAAMAVTSFPAMRQRLGPRRWQLLHTTGTWFLSVIYLYDFVLKPAVTGKLGEPRYAVFAALLMGAYGWRALSRLRRPLEASPTRHRSPAPPSPTAPRALDEGDGTQALAVSVRR